jgi:hypothetical protein
VSAARPEGLWKDSNVIGTKTGPKGKDKLLQKGMALERIQISEDQDADNMLLGIGVEPIVD